MMGSCWWSRRHSRVENLRRADLDPPYRMHVTSRRKFLYELIHPETTNGSNQHTRVRNNCEPSIPDRFTSTTAKVTGRSERSVQLDAQIGKEIGADILKTAGTSLGTVTELKALAEIKDVGQRADLIAAGAYLSRPD